MPKRKRAAPAGRKKQAVTITLAATKAIIERNASTSPLLKLPAEIRDEILALVLGRKLIHLVYIRRRRRRGCRHAVCTSPSSEYEAHEQFMTGYTHIPTHDSADFYSPTFKMRHAHCKSWDLEADRVWTDEERFLSRLKSKEERRTPMLDLSILGACRKMYEEANAILWSTNTFSFEDGLSLQKFIQGLHTTQSNKLTRVHIDMDWGLGRSEKQWREALQPSLMSKLNALQMLHITLDQDFMLIDMAELMRLFGGQPPAPHPLLAMQNMALKDVTVVIGDHVYNIYPEMYDEPNQLRWTIEQKREVAESLRSSLLNGHEWVRAPHRQETQDRPL